MKQYRVTTKVKLLSEPFVDWYEGETEAEARAVWEEDMHRYGLRGERVESVRFEEQVPENTEHRTEENGNL